MISKPSAAAIETQRRLWNLGWDTIRELEVENGILASGKDEAYGCIFGRDSLITSLTLLSVYEHTHDEYLRLLVRKVLINLCMLQGSEVNIESGEEPGKCIHEFRPVDHERLTRDSAHPWFVYPDNAMRNYDTVDATPLFLMAVGEYIRLVPADTSFADTVLPHVERALVWITEYGDSNGDGLIDYTFHSHRKYGGLRTQSWMDSSDSLFFEDGTPFVYPIAPVEVQGYTYHALRAWSHYFSTRDSGESDHLRERAVELKRAFNERFVYEDAQGVSLAFALDGSLRPMTSARSSMGHVLWAAWRDPDAPLPEAIVHDDYIRPLADRIMAPDLFEPHAGVRTLSRWSSRFDPVSYHNGSIWPHDTALVGQGLRKYGFMQEARHVHNALISAYTHFQTPVELFSCVDSAVCEYAPTSGHRACQKQAWSAASLLAQCTTALV